jgi:hypothetical protein
MSSVVATLIGDVVGSRDAGSRAALHARLEALVAHVNAETAPVVPLRITVGDEYQGCWSTVGQALVALRMLRLDGLPDVDLRHGLGWGEVTVLSEAPRVEDGPGWWAARAAIEYAAAEARRPGLRHVRTAFRLAEAVPGAERPGENRGLDEHAVNAALMLRDQLLGGLSERSLSVLRGLLEGRTQREIAEAEGVSASAVSQRVRSDGLAVIVAAEEMLGRVG